MSHRTFDDAHGTSDVARQGLLDNRVEHAKKRHRTLGRRRRMSKTKKRRVELYLSKRDKARAKYLREARMYWCGQRESHP